jgi:hypothetical protein
MHQTCQSLVLEGCWTMAPMPGEVEGLVLLRASWPFAMANQSVEGVSRSRAVGGPAGRPRRRRRGGAGPRRRSVST